MIILLTLWYPTNKTIDVAKRYLKQPREIPHVAKWRVFNTPDGKNGQKQYHLFYTERGKGEEAMGEIWKYFMSFNDIEGFEAKQEVLMGVSDSYKTIGLKWE